MKSHLLQKFLPAHTDRYSDTRIVLLKLYKVVGKIAQSCVRYSSGGAGVTDAQSNRDYVIQKMSNEIHEIIRVLQLTTYDEDEWDADDITVMKKAQV